MKLNEYSIMNDYNYSWPWNWTFDKRLLTQVIKISHTIYDSQPINWTCRSELFDVKNYTWKLKDFWSSSEDGSV